MIFDTHCHLGYDEDQDPAEVQHRAKVAGVSTLLNVGIDLASSHLAKSWAGKLQRVYYSAGLHPNHTGQMAAEWEEIAALCREPSCRAVGETGLDFYRDWTTPEQQEAGLEAHLRLALELDRPVVIHCRSAFPRTYEILGRYQGSRGVMHCFSSDHSMMKRCLDLGFHISFAGPLTYKKNHALREACRMCPLDRLLLETDAPFLPPQSMRGKRNESCYILETARLAAGLHGIPLLRLEETTTRNAKGLFGLC